MRRWHWTLALFPAIAAAGLLAPTLAPRPAPSPSEDGPPAPSDVTPLTLSAGSVQDADGTWTVIRIAAPADATTPDAIDVAVVIDTSGSMYERGKLSSAKAAARQLASHLGPDDRLSIVTFDDRARVLVDRAGPESLPSILARIDAIDEGGATNLYDGVAEGARLLAGRGSDRGGRLVLLSDGRANAGVQDPGMFEEIGLRLAHDAVSVTALGVGLDYDESLLLDLATVSGGTWRHVGDPRELPMSFTEAMDDASRVVARDVTVAMTVPADVRADVVGWPSTRQGAVLTVPVGTVLAGETRTVVLRTDPPTPVDARVSWRDAARGREASGVPTPTDVDVTDAKTAAALFAAADRAAAHDLAGAMARVAELPFDAAWHATTARSLDPDVPDDAAIRGWVLAARARATHLARGGR